MSSKVNIDDLDEAAEGNFQYQFESIPQTEHIKTWCPSLQVCGDEATKYLKSDISTCRTVEQRDLKRCYFAPILSEIREETPTKPIPKDLYCNEFLKLNPLCISDLLAFQEEYGIILGARLNRHVLVVKNPKDIRPCPDEQVFSGDWRENYSYQFEGIQASASIFDKLLSNEKTQEVDATKLAVVSFQEAIFAVLNTQTMIKNTIRVLRDDLPKITKRELFYAAEDTNWLAKLLPKTMPIIKLVKEDANFSINATCLMDGIHLQLARGLVSNAAYRTCQNPECQRLFTPVEMQRRLDTKYCCKECQERAKRLRYINKHSK